MSLPYIPSQIELFAIGEVLVEFTHQPTGGWQQRISGDVFNTVAHASALGHKVAVITAIGNDDFTPDIETALVKTSSDMQFCITDNLRRNGCYWVLPEEGQDPCERFKYQRTNTAASALLPSAINWERVFERTEWIYFTGVSQAVMKAFEQEWVPLLQQAQLAGCKVAYDPNYRTNLWPSAQHAVSAMMSVLPYVDAFLPSLEDLEGLIGVKTPEAALGWLQQLLPLPSLVVLKASTFGHWVIQGEQVTHYDAPVLPPNLIGAGDELNARMLLALI